MADQATIHPDALPAQSLTSPKGVFAQLADVSRHASNLPVYRKVRQIGRGAFGKAYLVEVVRRKSSGAATAQRVLKKLPLADLAVEQREAAFREAQLMRKISRNCHFITQFNEVLLCKGGSVLCLVMEFCSGGDLRQVLRERDGNLFPEAQVLEWAAQIALALHHCHSRGVLHRDVKPDNCFFRSKDGDLLLGDFGISCSLDEQHFAKTCCGSPMYLSPEIVNQETYSYSSDCWALGVMLYEMAMLQAPFKGTNICQIAFKIVSSTPQGLDPGFSADLQRLIERLLEKDALTRASLAEAMSSSPLEAWVAAAAARHDLPWPPSAEDFPSSRKGSGLVHRLRKTAGSARPAEEEDYADDFEAYDDEDEDEFYQDDFEDASGSDASYTQDFEALSESDEGNTQAPLAESEESLRQQIFEELGEEAMSIAESLGVVAFLEGMRRSQQR